MTVTPPAIAATLSDYLARCVDLERENQELRAALVTVLAWISERDALWRLVETEIAVRWPEEPS